VAIRCVKMLFLKMVETEKRWQWASEQWLDTSRHSTDAMREHTEFTLHRSIALEC